MKLLFVSLGCDKNLVDSERMLGALAGQDFTITDNEEEADVIIVNTCCFIDSAKEESINTILEMARYRREGACRALVVTGCLAQRYKDEVLTEIPEVDAIVGTNSWQKITEAVSAALGEQQTAIMDPLTGLPEIRTGRVITTGGFYEYLKIAEGCDRHCTYCVIPSVRGRYRSVPMEDLLREAESLASDGIRELILVAQETTRYGLDLYGEKSLHILLEKLCAIEGLHWIRVLYCYPEEIYPELVRVMAEQPKICRYLDLPIQHASDRVLGRMGRKTTRKDLERIIAELREAMPDITLRTTLISGFPGETEEQHQELMDFVGEQAFERLGVFAYSREDGTPAASFPDQIPEEVKERRRGELLSLQQEISSENGEDHVGEVLEVFVEGYLPDEHVWVGRSRMDAPDVDGLVFISTGEALHTGDFVRVRITGAMEYDLTGELENESAE